ncbi:MAG: LptF/LptG family permease, partial [Reichenbachiella sp.]|uniref:LptF/LptG family permease n=1 Tax=Reichenbachiella sp. TaxID=2184521 RepID=UPI003299081D
MKKLDKLILKSFIGPFIVTFLVAVFILLLVYMMKYFDDFIGKNLGFMVLAELMGYFSINQMPMALPLAVLISSLMTYGKLGEHFELTAIKGSGISLLRIILPAFVFCVMLAIGAFVLSDQVVPTANLRAFSLLYDIKQTKPSLDLREGQFYNGIPKYSIKISKKYPDGVSIKDIIIYDHTAGDGIKRVIIADSCRMYSFMGDRYLKMDLYNGNHYIEEEKKKSGRRGKDEISQFVRT